MKKIYQKEIEALACLHYKNLPDSSPSLLGYNYVRSTYYYFSLSSYEHIISISCERKKYSGLSIYSAKPDTLGRRLLTNTPVISEFFKMCLSQPLGKTYRKLDTMLSSLSNEKPELLYLCVDPSARGMGLGSQLVKKTIDYSLSRNDKVLYVRCENHLVEFYTNLGFVPSQKKEGPDNFLSYSQTLVSPIVR